MSDKATEIMHVSISEAARTLGVSPQTVRRRIKSGELTAERQMRPQGLVYRVSLPIQMVSSSSLPGSSKVESTQIQPLRVRDDGQSSRDIATALREALSDLRAARARIDQLEAERLELYERLVHLQSDLATAQERTSAPHRRRERRSKTRRRATVPAA